jgi:hypothetical protein
MLRFAALGCYLYVKMRAAAKAILMLPSSPRTRFAMSRLPRLRMFAVAAVLACGGAWAQEREPVAPPPASPGELRPQAECVPPADMAALEDYRGPLRKLFVALARKPEIRTAHLHESEDPCALTPGDKLHLFASSNLTVGSFLGTAFYAGIGQAADTDPSFGQGAEGYGKRYGATLADRLSSEFFTTFAYPSLLGQDPRYYRLGHGSFPRRLGHALSHSFVSRSDGGRPMPNLSQWMGATSASALVPLYHPDAGRGAQPLFRRAALGVATDAGWNLLREFWPEVARRLRLPFVQREPPPPQEPAAGSPAAPQRD